ncbi:MAG: hypothetical protein LBM07_01170 [Culturomica sp.]|jgi:two-component system LytT family response regulator|nr:hypothetical protein [Culturomica sp.]
MKEVFSISTLTGYQILHLKEIGYFEYDKEQRIWKVVSIDQKDFKLRRQTCAADIIASSPSFTQINQCIIINLLYLTCIEDNTIILRPPFQQPDTRVKMKLSRSYRKELNIHLLWL